MEAAIRRTAARRRCVAADCGDGSYRIQATVTAPLPLLVRMHPGATKPFSVAAEAALKQRCPMVLIKSTRV
jgi:hypothetical protein